MRTAYKTPATIVDEGFDALVERLGAAGALRYVLQFERGTGNYTEERKHLLHNVSIDNLPLKHRRKRKK